MFKLENAKLSNFINVKELQKIYLAAIMVFCFVIVTVVSGATNVHAVSWGTTLSRGTLPVTLPWTLTRNYNVKSNVSLTRIVNGPSYYIYAETVNGNGAARTDNILVQQNSGYKNFTNDAMVQSYNYSLKVANSYFETTERSAYGYCNW